MTQILDAFRVATQTRKKIGTGERKGAREKDSSQERWVRKADFLYGLEEGVGRSWRKH